MQDFDNILVIIDDMKICRDSDVDEDDEDCDSVIMIERYRPRSMSSFKLLQLSCPHAHIE